MSIFSRCSGQEYRFQFQKGAIKIKKLEGGEVILHAFQFQKGAIKIKNSIEDVLDNELFQFQKGAIKIGF